MAALLHLSIEGCESGSDSWCNPKRFRGVKQLVRTELCLQGKHDKALILRRKIGQICSLCCRATPLGPKTLQLSFSDCELLPNLLLNLTSTSASAKSSQCFHNTYLGKLLPHQARKNLFQTISQRLNSCPVSADALPRGFRAEKFNFQRLSV